MMQQIAIQPQFWILPIPAAVFSALAVYLIVGGVRRHKAAKRDDRYTSVGEGRVMAGIIAALFGGGAFITWFVLLIPYSAEYLMFYRVTGQVESVTRSFSDGSGDLTVRPVVFLSDFDRPVVVDDSRIYSYVGDRVDLTCSIEWVPYGEDRINCFIAATR